MNKNYHWVSDAGSLPFDPALRKATSLMKLVHHGLGPYLESSDTSDEMCPPQIFFSSRHGEIEPTLNYLKGYAQKELARPFLFQNSLHHSTTGFVSHKFHLLGPSFSICAVDRPQQEVMLAALIQMVRDPRPTILITGESFPEELAAISSFESESTCEILAIGQESCTSLATSKDLADGFDVVCSFKDLLQIVNSERYRSFKIEGYSLGFIFVPEK